MNLPADNAADVDESNTSAHHAPILVENGKIMSRKTDKCDAIRGAHECDCGKT